MGQAEHRRHARDVKARVHVITASDTRTAADDESGALIRAALVRAGHEVAGHAVLRDEPALIIAEVLRACADPGVNAVIVNGGTGISARDATFEAIDGALTRRIPGFGEIFRFLSYREIGPSAMLSRATAGLVDRTLVFALPGSANAVALAMNALILPELSHALWEISR